MKYDKNESYIQYIDRIIDDMIPLSDKTMSAIVVVMALLIAFGVMCGSYWVVVPFVIAMILLALLEADAICYILFGFLIFSLMILVMSIMMVV